MQTYVVHRTNGESVMVEASLVFVTPDEGMLILFSAAEETSAPNAVFAPGQWTHITSLPEGGAE